MAYLLIENFNQGLDRRRSINTAPPGTLWILRNAHINRGGEIEGKKAFFGKYNLPVGTFGLADLQGTLYVFGHGDEPVGMPSGVIYQKLAHPDGSTSMSEVLDVDVFDGKLYVIARYADGKIYHFYDGVRVTYWDSGTVQGGTTANADIATALESKIEALADYTSSVASNVITITAATAGKGFAYSATSSGTGTLTFNETQANVAQVDEKRATGSFRVTGGTASAGVNKVDSVTVNGVTITSGAVDWTTSNAGTATALAANINAHTSVPDYTAVADGDTVSVIAAAGTGDGPNGFALVVNTAGNVTAGSIVNMAGGVDAASAVAQEVELTVGGVWQAGDTFSVTLGNDVVGGNTNLSVALTYGSKMYVGSGSLLNYSKLNDPKDWNGTGSGFINMSNHSSGSDQLTALSPFNQYMAIFSRAAIQLWTIKEDAANNDDQQKILNTGTIAPGSVIPFTEADLFYLSDSGLRALKPRNVDNTAISNDVGRPIDSLLTAKMAELSEDVIRRAGAIIEPFDGRYWLSLEDLIYIFTSYPASGNGNISAWSIYDPGFTPEKLVTVGNRIYVRSGNTIYLYGGDDNTLYDDTEVEVLTPFLSARSPANFKEMKGIDLACQGTWEVKIYVDPDDLTQYVDMGVLEGNTYLLADVMGLGNTTHFAIGMKHRTAEYCRVGQIAVHYEELDT